MVLDRLFLIRPLEKLLPRFLGRLGRTPKLLLMRLELLSGLLNGGEWVLRRGGGSSRSLRGWFGRIRMSLRGWRRRMRVKRSGRQRGMLRGRPGDLGISRDARTEL